jgi:DNA-binding GntR family transcriptional regulator
MPNDFGKQQKSPVRQACTSTARPAPTPADPKRVVRARPLGAAGSAAGRVDVSAAPGRLSTVRSVPTAPGPLSTDDVADHLRGRIRAGTLPGGTRLVQKAIAEELAVSPSSVRSALRQLEAQGMVRRRSERGGAVVHELSRTELVELYEIRKLLEPVATARAAKCASAESILAAVELMAVMSSEEAAPRWAEYNQRFHSIIEEAGSSPRLAVILRNLRELSTLYVTHSILSEPERVSRAHAEHEEILRAFVDRDPEAAADAVLRHLDGTLTTLLTFRQVGSAEESWRR